MKVLPYVYPSRVRRLIFHLQSWGPSKSVQEASLPLLVQRVQLAAGICSLASVNPLKTCVLSFCVMCDCITNGLVRGGCATVCRKRDQSASWKYRLIIEHKIACPDSPGKTSARAKQARELNVKPYAICRCGADWFSWFLRLNVTFKILAVCNHSFSH